MIEAISAFPDNIVALVAKGRVTKNDYDEIVIPKVEAALKRHKKIRLYYELGSQFAGIDPGAAWEDLVVGLEHLTSWERVAIVTDVEWIRHVINGFRFLMPSQLRVFTTADAAEAKAWVLT